jgi:Family of unknown function (DUF6527)
MSSIKQLRAEFVEFIPEPLQPGVIYVSRRYSTASHLCCCGCGLETVTPLNAAKWNLTERGGLVSLWPSVGNWNFPCQSHYIIRNGRVVWAAKLSPGMIAEVKSLDHRDAELLALRRADPLNVLAANLAAAWRAFVRWFGG